MPADLDVLPELQGDGHIIADATHDAHPIRAFIVDALGATAQIKTNPSRAIDWILYKERQQVGYFFNKLKRLLRMA